MFITVRCFSALLEGYAKLCTAAQCISPALADFEAELLQNKFSLTWEVFNKHLYQTIVYTDPLVTKHLSQVICLTSRWAIVGHSQSFI